MNRHSFLKILVSHYVTFGNAKIHIKVPFETFLYLPVKCLGS